MRLSDGANEFGKGWCQRICVCVSHFTDVKDTDTDVTDLIDTFTCAEPEIQRKLCHYIIN